MAFPVIGVSFFSYVVVDFAAGFFLAGFDDFVDCLVADSDTCVDAITFTLAECLVGVLGGENAVEEFSFGNSLKVERSQF